MCEVIISVCMALAVIEPNVIMKVSFNSGGGDKHS